MGNKNNLSILFIVVIVAVLASAAYLTLFKNNKNQNLNQIIPITNNQNTNSSSNVNGNFCGTSRKDACNINTDCIEAGCSGQICQAKDAEGGTTTCEWKDCYNAGKYGLTCKCVSNQCQWSK